MHCAAATLPAQEDRWFTKCRRASHSSSRNASRSRCRACAAQGPEACTSKPRHSSRGRLIPPDFAAQRDRRLTQVSRAQLELLHRDLDARVARSDDDVDTRIVDRALALDHSTISSLGKPRFRGDLPRARSPRRETLSIVKAGAVMARPLVAEPAMQLPRSRLTQTSRFRRLLHSRR